tara:strand:- start:506 stop:634 length:129 start_codon:yes stop_codon:yes gene_type:complete
MSNRNKNKDVQTNFLLNWATKNTKVGKRTEEKNKAIKKLLSK